MLVKDLLILFQACNEGVINVLEHYFEMSHIDAEEALGIYKNFCKQTERVVEYLGVAKKLQNLLNVSIPNLRHVRPDPFVPECPLTIDIRRPFRSLVHWKSTSMTPTSSRTG